MDSICMDKTHMDLFELQSLISSGIENAVPDALWLKAEIASMNVRRGGHCYMELSQSRDGMVSAQIRAIVWASIYRQIEPYFLSVTGVPLGPGVQVLLFVRVQYSALYGLSLIVDDIDPAFTVGEAELKRKQTLERLTAEGLVDAQKEFSVPQLPYRIAVVSSPEAAGYRDFMRHLHENEYGFRFSTMLYPSPMQGPGCAEGVAAALNEIEQSGIRYDVVALLRGGGSKLDLAWYDEYEMCAAIARHSFPVITAIGHDQDTHLCDLVAFESVKTPTALADWFIDIYAAQDARLWDLRTRLKNARRSRIALMEHQLDVLKTRLEALDPQRLLRAGYMLMLDSEGRRIASAKGVNPGDRISLMMEGATLRCTVNEIEHR